MLRCASPFVIAAYKTVRLIPQGSHALPAAFLRSRPKFKAFVTFYDGFLIDILVKAPPAVLRGRNGNHAFLPLSTSMKASIRVSIWPSEKLRSEEHTSELQ